MCFLQDAAAMLAPGVCMNIISARHSKDGYGTVSNPEKFLNQDFQQLKEYCVIRRVRFIDDMFPPDHRSIGRDVLQPADLVRVEWVRPSVSSGSEHAERSWRSEVRGCLLN